MQTLNLDTPGFATQPSENGPTKQKRMENYATREKKK
jgi:hypothetical protein